MQHMPNVFINLSIQRNLTAEMWFTAYIKNALCINLLVFYLKNGNPLSGGPHYSQVKMRTQSGRGLKPNMKNPREPPNSTINPVKYLFEELCVYVFMCMYTCAPHPRF